MSVAELKVQAEALSPREIDELSRHLRALSLRRSPVWKAQLASAVKNPQWVAQAEVEQAIADLEHAGK